MQRLLRKFGWGRATNPEVRVISAVLSATGDPRSKKLIEQVRRSTKIKASKHRHGYVMRLTMTTEDLAPDISKDALSDWIEVPNRHTGRPLKFRVRVGRGGFFGPLEASVDDGDWPKTWDVDDDELRKAAVGALKIPPANTGRSCVPALCQWLGISTDEVKPRIRLRCQEPADEASIKRLEAREGEKLPTEVEELLRVSNGIEIRKKGIFGTDDLYVVELWEGSKWWVLWVDELEDAWTLTPVPDEPDEGAVVLCPSHDARREDLEQLAPNLKLWVEGLVKA